MTPDFAAHLDTLFSCRACPRVAGLPVTGAVAGARVMLVGQAPGPREADERRPFAWTAGRRLFAWFSDRLGVPEERFRQRVHIGAVIRCFPGRDAKNGGDRVPDSEEIARCSAHLDRELQLLAPVLVLAVGTLAAKQMVGMTELRRAVGRLHRVTRAGQEFDVVVLPHPSGRSTWLNSAENAALLTRSLGLIEKHPAWRTTVATGGVPAAASAIRAKGRSSER
jgi:uracil-DNA glycosylase